ncbi:MAG: hemolysin III family protein [Chitinophagales bacterium]|nr:hemolysin III family protein [Chitinophagales bacterium]
MYVLEAMDKHKHREEFWNTFTHGLGLLLSILALGVFSYITWNQTDWVRTLAFSVYGLSLVTLYAASTLYHYAKDPDIKRYLRIFDHSAIYVLIAGSYTPFALITLKAHGGYTLLAIIWGITVVGVIFKLFFTHRFNFLSTILYLGMGWIAVTMYGPLTTSLHPNGLYWLVAGGLVYTAGTVFFLWDRLPYNHAIWHLFVLGGSICHFMALYNYVLPSAV